MSRTLRSLFCQFPYLMAALVTIQSASAVHAQQAFFQGLGFLPGFNAQSSALDISGDGSIIVGTSDSGSPNYTSSAFLWTREAGMTKLDTATGGLQISNDGSTVIGMFYDVSSNDYSFFRWREGTGMVPLGVPPGFSGNSFGVDKGRVTGDGSTIAAFWHTWTETGGWARSPNGMLVRDISNDGQSFIGYQGIVRPAEGEGYLWSVPDGMTLLGPPYADGALFFNPRSLSGNGKVVVGYGFKNFTPGTSHNFRWTQETGLIDIGIRVDEYGGLSHDGSVVVVGDFIWRETSGTERLTDVLVNEYGLGPQLAGWQNLVARSISDDGRTIVGDARNPAGKYEAFIAYLGTPVPEPSSLLLATLAPFAFLPRSIRFRNSTHRQGR